MDAEQVAAAAERLRRFDAGEDVREIYDTYLEDARSRQIMDAFGLARAHLAALAAPPVAADMPDPARVKHAREQLAAGEYVVLNQAADIAEILKWCPACKGTLKTTKEWDGFGGNDCWKCEPLRSELARLRTAVPGELLAVLNTFRDIAQRLVNHSSTPPNDEPMYQAFRKDLEDWARAEQDLAALVPLTEKE